MIRTLRFAAVACVIMMICMAGMGCGSSSPKFYSLGVSADRIKAVYEQRGYEFSAGEKVYGQPQVVGVSPSGLTVVQLVGPEDDLVSVRITSRFTPPHTQQEMAFIRLDMEMIFPVVVPQWQGAKQWFVDRLMEIDSNGYRMTKRDGIDVRVEIIEEHLAHGVSFGAWMGIAVPTEDGWDTATD